KWSLDVCVEKVEPDRIPVWVKLFNIPLEAWSVKGISALASRLGKPLVMDDMTTNMCHNGTGRSAFARVLMEIEADKGFKDLTEIKYKDKSNNVIRTKFVKVEFSWKPISCSHCNVFGHSDSRCYKNGTKKDQMENDKGTKVHHENKGFVKVRHKRYGFYRADKRKEQAKESITINERGEERWAGFMGYSANSYTNNIPWILMGDFNVTLKTSEHTTGGSCITRYMNDFNNCVNNLELEDICSSGFQFTWTKSLKNPKSSIMKKLDRIMFNSEFLHQYQNVSGEFIPFVILDHSPVVVTIPEGLKMKKRSFRFIIFIADKEEFADCLTSLKEKLTNAQAKIKKDPFNSKLKTKAADYLNEYLVASNDELKLLQQKAKIKWFSESDQNTAYFYGILKSRKHKGRIESICDEKGVIFNGDNVANAFVKNFKNFLRSKHDVHPLGSVKIKFDKVLSKKEAEDMIGLVSDKEIKEAVFDIDSNKASGPDGYTSGFFKKAWHIVGKEVCLEIKDFFLNAKLLGEINANLIALIPKVDMPKKVSEFRPIACCNVIYKSISKILTNRIKKGLQKVVNFNHSAFIPRRHTQDNILIAQELLKGYQRKKGARICALKIDILKANDTVSWEFLGKIMLTFGFHHVMVNWIMTV
nr:hypothetical protein [Tanacetum cinerariifolium]